MLFENIKELLIADFTSVKNNFYVTIGSIYLLNDKTSYEKLLNNKYENIDLTPLGFNLIDSILRQICLQSFLKSGFRTAIRESYELIYEYCKKTNQLEVLKKVKWYQFHRILRNGAAHDFKFSFSKNELKILPVDWNGKIISREMNEQYISLNQFTYSDLWILLEENEAFINEIN